YELLDFLDPVLDHLGSRHRIANVHRILEHGTGADRQLAVFEQTKNLTDVAKFIQGQYLAGI
ncbi:MAG TPA: carboxylate-amine ligase, partial [Chitinophagaceae bacterium]|nr:carboxylate-amine ligase [Chitinophagaceae bacterium]HPN58400.1 carboxylate-amine ligase [Chitinophagaceae bacterium]